MATLTERIASRFLLRNAYRLRKSDKKVIQAFVQKKAEEEGHILQTDGRVLEKLGLGSERVARWRGKHIAILSSESTKSDDVIIRYLTKLVGKDKVLYDHKRGDRKPTIQFSTGGDALHPGQWDGWIYAYIPEESKPVGKLHWQEFEGEISIAHVRVSPKYRRQGIARAMYQKLFKDQNISRRDLGSKSLTDDGAAFRKRL